MSEDLSLLITGRDGVTKDYAKAAQSLTWAGSIKECARTLDVPLLSTAGPCEMGYHALLRRGGEVLFDGYSFGRDRDTDSEMFSSAFCDRGIYLKKSDGYYKFKGLTAEAITRRICADFGFKVGTLCETGVPISRNFPGVKLYAMIATAYHLAAEQTGERYAIRFRGDALEVVAKRKGPETLVIKPGSNLRHLSVSESVSDMVNQVAIYDSNGALVGTQKEQEAIKLYGLFQRVITQSKGKDAAKEAKRILEDSGAAQKVTVTVNGNPKLISGSCVVLRESVTGLYGLFWIDGDTHTWTKDGDYTTKLTLNFKNMMDEQEAGSLPSA